MLEKYAPLLNWQESQVSGVRTFDALGWLKVLPTITLKYVFINGRIILVHKCVAALPSLLLKTPQRPVFMTV